MCRLDSSYKETLLGYKMQPKFSNMKRSTTVLEDLVNLYIILQHNLLDFFMFIFNNNPSHAYMAFKSYFNSNCN